MDPGHSDIQYILRTLCLFSSNKNWFSHRQSGPFTVWLLTAFLPCHQKPGVLNSDKLSSPLLRIFYMVSLPLVHRVFPLNKAWPALTAEIYIKSVHFQSAHTLRLFVQLCLPKPKYQPIVCTLLNYYYLLTLLVTVNPITSFLTSMGLKLQLRSWGVHLKPEPPFRPFRQASIWFRGTSGLKPAFRHTLTLFAPSILTVFHQKCSYDFNLTTGSFDTRKRRLQHLSLIATHWRFPLRWR